MTHPIPSRSAHPLELLVLQHRGQDVDFSWQWPHAIQGECPQGAAGPLRAVHQISEVSFAEILAPLDGMDAAWLAQMRACMLQRVGAAEQPLWLLGNSSTELVCSVNQHRLACGSQLRLAHGDEIELGLTRCVVALEPSQAGLDVQRPGPSPLAVADSGLRAVAAPGGPPRAFALSDLDTPAPSPERLTAMQKSMQSADFSDLIAIGAAALAQHQQHQQHQQLQQHSPQRQGQPAQLRQGSDTAAPAATPLAATPAPAPAPSTSTSPSPFPSSAGAGADLLQQLHANYLKKLSNPTATDTDAQWQELVRSAQSGQSDPMQQWMAAAGSNPSLDDLLALPQSMDAVMQGLDGLGGADLLGAASFDSVMHLFAPEGMRGTMQESLESMVRQGLPGLTQREHHNLSLDSAMPFVGGRKPPESDQ